MANMPPAMRCTSSGGLSTGGSANVTTNVTASENPVTLAASTIQMPSSSTMPSTPAAGIRPNTR